MEINVKYDNMWKLLNKYDFNINLVENPDFVCVICHGLLKNAHQHVCGCRYCYECIQYYLSNNDNKCCPGTTEDCKDSIININTNIQIDHSANKAISKTIFNCPIAFCTFKDQLRNIEHHIESIHKNKCPFIEFGCTKDINCEADVSDHLSREYRNHTDMLMESIENMKNSLTTMRNDSREKDLRIIIIHKALERLYERQNGEIESLRSEVAKHRAANEKLMDNIRLSQNTIEMIQKDLQKQQAVTAKLQSVLNLMDDKVTSKTRQIEDRLNKFDAYSVICEQEQDKMARQIKDAICETEVSQQQLVKYAAQTEAYIDDWFAHVDSEPKIENYSPFEWRIDNFTDLWEDAKTGRNNFIFSDAFYSHSEGYKMCLKAYPNGDESGFGRYLSLFFCIVKGEWDAELPWPMNHNVVLRLIDQKSGVTFLFEEFDYYSSAGHEKSVFMRPSETMNSGLGASKFIELDELFSNSRLLRHDSIVLRCSVDM